MQLGKYLPIPQWGKKVAASDTPASSDPPKKHQPPHTAPSPQVAAPAPPPNSSVPPPQPTPISAMPSTAIPPKHVSDQPPSFQLVPYTQAPSSPASSPDTIPSLKLPRSSPSNQRFSTFTDQLNFFTKPITTFSLDSTPWMLGGDFNQILHPAEHSSTAVSSLSPDMIQFKDCLSQMGMFDLRFQGSFFSWTNRYPEASIAKKLDRLLINSQILTLYPDCSAFFLPSLTSDHASCMLNLAYKIPSCDTRPFKFFSYLSKHPCFHQVVLDSWTQAGSWNLNALVQIMQAPTPQLFELEKQAIDRWNYLRMIEECYFTQRSRINWLKEGDLNTTYFFLIVQTRLNFNIIRLFTLPSGTILTDPLEMSSHAVRHFSSTLGPGPPHCVVTASTAEWFQSLSPFRCDQDQSIKMTAIPTCEEITTVMHKLNPNKAPGPDGLTSGFYKATWSILGNEVTASIQHFFFSSFMPSATNSTILTLVPKHARASLITDF
ncbi:PREDICTED: uncharacterized protein LOC106309213 [Brassica oleracea var. oleracea]|uniref:uncharacterized protein LOC106309213 n=1 Tax=Brassica oleracea var. oleracea TaxID=109376 RepID=UPI0006A6D9A6|nr:PREDICTED: uncharacterized protein LOC106309213 [Brassica oleracea var. oleracea]